LYKLEKTTKEPPNSAKQTHNIAWKNNLIKKPQFFVFF
jgi:hypothetical protein